MLEVVPDFLVFLCGFVLLLCFFLAFIPFTHYIEKKNKEETSHKRNTRERGSGTKRKSDGWFLLKPTGMKRKRSEMKE